MSDLNDMKYRKLSIEIENGQPKTIDIDKRSVTAIAATSAPVRVVDTMRGVVDEVLLMRGVELPGNGQLPLLDSHSRGKTADVIGSFRNIQVNRSDITGTAYFSETASDIFTKIREGHLTDFSVGFRVLEDDFIESGETRNIDGQSFKGPLKLVSRWEPLELSVVPIGADKNAKARADAPDETIKEKNMDKQTFEFLKRCGLPDGASEEEAIRFMAEFKTRENQDDTPEKPEKPKEDDKDNVRELGAMVERERIKEITATCRNFSMDQDFELRMIEQGATVDHVRKAILDKLATRNVNIGIHPATVTDDAEDKFKRAANDALSMRAGIKIEKENPGASHLRGFSLIELARESLRVRNLDYSGDNIAIAGRALTTTDFPYLLQNVANKTLFEGFENAGETWPTWCDTGSASDFKTNYLPRVSEADTLVENPEGMPGDYGTFTEAQESYKVRTYRKMYAITRPMIINDDIGTVIRMTRAMGEAAARTVGNLAYAVLTANANMGDGLALFVSGHGNLAAGGDVGLPGVATMTELERSLMVQTDEKGLQVLNIPLRYIIAPAALKGTSETFFNSERFSDNSTVATDSSFASTRYNRWFGNVERVYDARLDATSETAWYGAGPKGKTVTMFFLNGRTMPTMETQKGWSVHGTEFDVYIDAVAKAVSWKALYRNPGE